MRKLAAALALGVSLLTFSSNAFAYEVKPGDTMSGIARAHSLNLQELSALNAQVDDLDVIYVGQIINTQKKIITSEPVKAVSNSSATAGEIDLLARLVRAEAQGEPYAGKVAVAAVVLNRVDSADFPNSITAVIYQSGQFSPVASGTINRAADAESIRAVEEALTYDRSRGAGSLFFYNPATATSRWLDSRPTTLVIGNHVFKK